MTSTHTSTWASAVKSIPCPGTTCMALSMSASRSWPRARSAATACALVVPAGMREPITPEKMMSVAWPSTRGPVTVSATLAAPSASTTASSIRSGRSRPSSRRLERLKSRAFSAGK